MRLPFPRRALWGASLVLCALATCTLTTCTLTTCARAQNATTAAKPDSPVPTPVDANGNATVSAPVNATVVAQQRTATPEERRQQTEDKLRALMVNLGINAAATQDSILDYLAEDETARASLREAEKSLLNGLRRDVPPERMRDLLGDYRAAIDSDKTNRVAAQRRLDARVGYSLDPKLEAMLWLMGVLGEGASKLPTSALALRRPDVDTTAGAAPAQDGPIYGPLLNPNFGARGAIVGTVTAKGVTDNNEHWLEIRDDSGALERYAAPWREDLKTLDGALDKQLSETPLSARVRVQWVWQERRRALQLQPEESAQPVTKVLTP